MTASWWADVWQAEAERLWRAARPVTDAERESMVEFLERVEAATIRETLRKDTLTVAAFAPQMRARLAVLDADDRPAVTSNRPAPMDECPCGRRKPTGRAVCWWCENPPRPDGDG